ncbi:MAG: hypothetical protein ACOY3D_08195 [Candidatus Omnitrophota bacterium]
MRIFRRLIIILGVLFLTLLILSAGFFLTVKHLKLKDIVEEEIESSLGINVTIEKLEFSGLLSHIGARGITIHNPAGFLESELAYLNAIHLTLDPFETFIRKKPNIYLLALDLKRLNIVKNADGRVNIKELIPIREGVAREDQTPFYFKVLVLSVGEVTYTDHTQRWAKTRRYPVRINNASFVNLQDEQAVTRLIIYKALENTDVGRLINLTIVPVFSSLNDTVGAAWGTAKSGVKGAVSIATLPFKLLFGHE